MNIQHGGQQWLCVLSFSVFFLFTAVGCSKFEWSNTREFSIQANGRLVESDSNFVDDGTQVPALSERSNAWRDTADAIDHINNNIEINTEDNYEERKNNVDDRGALAAAEDGCETIEGQANCAAQVPGVPLPQSGGKDAVTISVAEPHVGEHAPESVAKVESCIDLNKADVKELMQLPGIGEQRAKDIVALRNRRAFKKKRDITKVNGIGKKTFQKMESRICDL